MSQHAVASPSGAEGWMGCPGSLAMQKGLPDDSNEYSDEGTAAHLLGSTCLEKGTNPGEYEGRVILVGRHDESDFDGAVWGPNEFSRVPDGFDVRRTYTVDEDMIEHVGKYVDRVRQYGEGAVLLTPEQRTSIEHLTGEKGAAGTTDAAIVLPGELQIHDLKYGMGVRVDAKDNKQLKIYALGVIEELELAYGPFERIRLVIHQPRISDVPSEWDCTYAELAAFAEEVKAKASLALGLYEVGPDPKHEQWVAQYLNPSDDACKWCKAKPSCPALAKFVIDAAGADFEAITEPLSTFAHDPVDATPAALAQKMAAIPLIEDWCKAVRAEVERQLFAGLEVPGWKIVQGKRGNRTWSDASLAEQLLKDMRLTLEDRYTMKLKSPPAIEKVLKDTPRRWKRVLGLVVQPDGKPSVAPASDPRPVWTAPDTSNDFTATQEVATA